MHREINRKHLIPELKRITNALGILIDRAPEYDKAFLRKVLEEYIRDYPEDYEKLHDENPLISVMLTVMEENTGVKIPSGEA